MYLMKLFDLYEWRDHLIESYSHGMRQKLIMTSVFMLETPMIIVDEPMVGLDPKSARIVKELFRDSLFLAHKSEIKKDCFEYCFMLEKENKTLYYWINWTGEAIKTDVRLTGKKSEYLGENLFDKNSDNTEFQYNMIDFVDTEVTLAPYSVTLFEVINNDLRN